MKDDEDARYVEAIKLAAGSVQYRNLSVTETLKSAITQLYNYYRQTNRDNYLKAALLHIQAYLEMGFIYEYGGGIFDNILTCLDTSREKEFPHKFYASRQVKLNKTQVKNMIRRWPASTKQKLKIEDVVQEILYKVKSRESGIFYYKCEVTKDLYELVINDSEMFFHDLARGMFYTFKI